MDVVVGNLTTDPTTHVTTGDVKLTCTEPCTCCNWRTASGTITSGAANEAEAGASEGTSMSVRAVGPDGFETDEVGQAFLPAPSGNLTISWKGGHGWANWEKQ